ncbi:MAG TPA: response regulator [Thermoanaerobaculia bacterium]|nr:response regulator [Thermoanaerobaculia bacterium]
MQARNADPRESVRRFDLAVQRNHVFVYLLALLTALAARALGVFDLHIPSAFIVCVSGCAVFGFYYFLFRRGISRDILNPLWLATDVIFVTFGIFATGGINSPWFIWYVATASAAAFAVGKRAAYAVSIANTLAYLGTLFLLGQAAWGNEVFLIAVCRMIFIFGASYFFLIGVANLQEKRLRIRELELAESRKVQELTRLTMELAEANRRSQESDRLKSQFLANMSHELRTPMNSIIGFAEILVERLDNKIEPKHANFLRHILSSGQHLLGIINDILDLSKIEAGKMEIYPEFFSIAPVIESVCHVMRGMSKSNPHFEIDVPADVPQIETDMAKFKQVLFNLLSNAVKFSPIGAPIGVRARFKKDHESDGAITVSVTDRGIGIDPQHHAVIFEEFRQVDGTARREFGGTGLGLALVKKFIELQGGTVRVESAPGRGSTFSFTLPVQSRAAVVSRPQEVEFVGRSDRVLVVEDDANAYELIAAALGSAGYFSLRARHGEEALKLARESRPVAVTLDLVLPGVDGWEVLKRLKADPETNDIPVVIISMVDNRDLGVALGADDYFVKPVDRQRLLDRIRAMTSNASRPRLLLIDDDAAVHALLDEELTDLGYAIESAYSGEQGLHCARDNAPDVILLDLMMPGMSGFEVADSLKENPLTANIPILVLTSKEISAEDRDVLQTKVSSFVQKGKSARDQLVREIRRVTLAPAREPEATVAPTTPKSPASPDRS